MLDHPLPDLAAWTTRFSAAPIPVLAATAEEIALLERVEAMRGDVDAHQLAEPVRQDPLMALKLLAEVARVRRRHHGEGGPETVTAALVMMGIGPFFRAFGELPQVEVQLAGQAEALAGLQRVLRRAHRAANFSLGFAVHRMDDDAEVLQLVALLHDFAEMLLWCHAPALALEIAHRQQADPALRSHAAQRAVLNIELSALQQALMQAWALPELLVHLADDAHAERAQVQNVVLAIRLARHTDDPVRGWDNPAVPDDLAAIAQLLNLSVGAAEELAHAIDG